MSSTLTTYVEDIARKRAAMVSEITEVPASPPRGEDEPNEDRIAQVKKRVQEIYRTTKGNPSNGQWAVMSRVLRLGVTSGKHQHWIGTRTDLKAPEPHKQVPWINAETEQEWTHWEKRASMVDKVKSWNRQVEESTSLVEPVDPLSATLSQPPKSQEPPKVKLSLVSTPIDPLDAPNPLGFSVVKRTKKLAVKGKPTGPTASQTSGRRGSMGPPVINNAKPVSKSNKPNQLPEPSLPPPSFSSSQILTSTPKPLPGAGSAKPISRQSNPLQASFSLATPSLHEIQPTPPPPAASNSIPGTAPMNSSQSLPAIPMPKTPTRPKQTFSISNIPNANNKRVLELEEVQAQKKARAAHSPRITAPTRPKTPEAQIAQPSTSRQAEPSPSPRFVACATNPLFANAVPDAPTTPTRKSKALPTLTDLLASGRKNKDGKRPTRLTPKAAETDVKPSIKGKEKEVLSDDELIYPSSEGNVSKDQGTHPSIPNAQVLDSLPVPVSIDEDNPYMLDPDALHPPSDDIDLLLASKGAELSPAKSLSSIADSDEEDEDDDPRSPPPDSSPITGTFSFNPAGFNFDPPVTSTQNPYGGFSAPNGSPGASAEQSFDFLGGSFPFRSSQGSTASKGLASSSRFKYSQYRSKQTESDNHPANSMDSWASVYKHRAFQYNSQLQSNIAKQVDEVDKLLEKDVDYEGWLKDPSPELEGEGAADAGLEESP